MGLETGEVVWLTTAGLAALGGAAQLVLRRLSRNAVEGVKDRAEVNIMKVTIEDNATLRAENAGLRAELRVIGQERNNAVAAMGAVTERVKYMGEMLHDLRNDTRLMSKEQRESMVERTAQLHTITDELKHNTVISTQAVERADAAYKEANTVNNKIKNIGLQVKDGTPLASGEAAGEMPIDEPKA